MPPSSASNSGILLAISGPAGSGKTTLCQRLLQDPVVSPRPCRLVTCTSRVPRPGERDGVDYYFLSVAEFERQIAAGEFFEHARVYGRLYGSRLRDVTALFKSGCPIVMSIDVQGAANLRRAYKTAPPEAGRLVTIFLQPPSLDELRQRLLGRNQDARDEIERRLQIATDEIARAPEFDHVVISADREEDFHKLLAIYHVEIARP